MTTSWPWPSGTATGVGSLPGTDPTEAAALVFGELPLLPHLPELPARGPGADAIGRGAGLLVDLAADLYAGHWRLVSRPGRDHRRTLDLLARDLDAFAAAGDGYSGLVKIQVVGPWTLAANLELPAGGRVVRDYGAYGDLAESLAEGVRAHVADVSRRLPNARVLLQVDEPSLPAVLAGEVPTDSGLYTYPAVPAPVAQDKLRQLVAAAGVPVLFHCCAASPPLSLFTGAGAVAVSLDLTQLDPSTASASDLDALGEVIDAGAGLFAGVVPSQPPAAESGAPASNGGPDGARPEPATASAAAAARLLVALWRQLGFPMERLPAQAVVTPTCGLAGAPAHYARTAMAAGTEAARRLAES